MLGRVAVGDIVEVFSVSRQQWHESCVSEVDGTLVSVIYTTGDGDTRYKIMDLVGRHASELRAVTVGLLPPTACRLPPAPCLLPPAARCLPPAPCRLSPPASCLLPASSLLPPAACRRTEEAAHTEHVAWHRWPRCGRRLIEASRYWRVRAAPCEGAYVSSKCLLASTVREASTKRWVTFEFLAQRKCDFCVLCQLYDLYTLSIKLKPARVSFE